MEDEKLVELALDGDDEALRTLHGRYVQPLFHYVYVQAGNHHDAEELIQDIFFKMAKNLARFQGKSSFKTWIFAISRNVVIDYHRKQKKHKATTFMPHSTLEAFTEKVHSAEEEVLDKGLKNYLLQTMNQLPTDYQAVLHLRFVEEFSVKETAEIMKKTTFSVKALQNRARKKMMSLIREEVGEG
ncbi:RNA polymerase sigma factor [Salipaludibacillus daqingensis]|uniref:RNA polymerase sigma factor n=1 Tax=Salipaludibacillus daqingensis TaxID=3041001 RepID=UPI00247620DD|nr:RNA polymerase sigma factor [Salipaludibacillus daqingensis]